MRETRCIDGAILAERVAYLPPLPCLAASHLGDDERVAAIKATREALDEAGFKDNAILVGTGTGSARETIKLTNQAYDAGADYSIVIFPGYFAFAMGKNRAALKEYFIQVLDNSKLPIMIYNFPWVPYTGAALCAQDPPHCTEC